MQSQIQESIQHIEDYANTLTEDAIDYWQYHKRRYEWTSNLIAELAGKLGEGGQPVTKILDIGPAYQTRLLERVFPDMQIDTLGFFDARFAPLRQTVHISFDLNDTFDPEKRLEHSGEQYAIIVMLEVIEHLYTSPKFIFTYLREIMQPHGVLVVQTPNAVSLNKRFKMLKGRNPYELISENRASPGHFREYTKAEMCQLAEAAGLEVVETHMLNYFNNRGLLSKISSVFPGSFREGMTLIIRKNDLPATR